jgi:uncharacterized protein (TIGR02271 family)
MSDDRTQNNTSSLPTPPQELHLREEEEQLQVGKRQVQAGEVQVHKTVHTEHQDVPVELAQENVEVERVDLPAGEVSSDAFQERQIEMPLKREEAVVSKSTHATEEVRLHKDVETERQTVGGTVRRSEVEIDDSEVDHYVTTPEERSKR